MKKPTAIGDGFFVINVRPYGNTTSFGGVVKVNG